MSSSATVDGLHCYLVYGEHESGCELIQLLLIALYQRLYRCIVVDNVPLFNILLLVVFVLRALQNYENLVVTGS